MHFSLFIHMERYDESISHQQAYEDLVELTQIAEAGGFRTVWIGEHHAMEYTISPNPMVSLANIAARTKTIHLGAGTIVASFWNPIRAAGETALLDVISGGRAEIGIARGAYQFEFDRLAGGMPAKEGGAYLRELVPAVQKLWAGDYAHDGNIWKFPVSTSVPKPIQKPGPPIWIAAREQDSHNFAVSQGCNVMVTPLMKDDGEVKDLTDKFKNACAASPDVPTPELMCLRHTHVHPASEPDGWKPAAEAISKFYRTFSSWAFGKTAPTNGFLPPAPESQFADRPEFELESIHQSAMIGTPDVVIDRIKKYGEMGVTEYSYWIDNSMSHEDKKKSLELFIAEVVPAFQD